VNIESVRPLLPSMKSRGTGSRCGPHRAARSFLQPGNPGAISPAGIFAAAKTIVSKARAAGSGAGIHFWGTAEESAAC